MATDLTPLWISLKTAGLATVVTFILGIAAAYGMLGDRQPGKSLVEAVFIAPLILPPTVVGFFAVVIVWQKWPVGKNPGPV